MTTVAPQRLRTQVIDAVAEAVAVDIADVTAVSTLFDLAGFDSLAVVAVLERLEDELRVEVPPELIVPEAFASIDALCDLLSAARPTGPADFAADRRGGSR